MCSIQIVFKENKKLSAQWMIKSTHGYQIFLWICLKRFN